MGCLKLDIEHTYTGLKIVYRGTVKVSRGSGKTGVETNYYYFGEQGNKSQVNLAFGRRETEQSQSPVFDKVESQHFGIMTKCLCGNRYYDPRTSQWLSVDPLASKYPHASPYNYCLGNPIIKIDPDGRSAGDIYNLNGEHIGNDGIDDKKVYLKITESNQQLTLDEAKAATANTGIQGMPREPVIDITAQTGLNNDELNLRSTLTTLSKAEAGRSNPPLEYNSWNNGATITDYSKHPGINPASGSSAAGFYQAMVYSFVGTDFTPQSQDKFAVNLMTSKSYKAALSGNMTDFKSAASGRWTSLKHWTGANLQSTFNANRANELIGVTRIATPVGSTVGLRGTLKI